MPLASPILHRVPALALLVAALLTGGCASMYNYVDEVRVYEKDSSGPAGTGDGITVVTFNLKYGRQSALAREELLVDPRTSRADVFLLQEVHQEAVANLAEGLRCAYVYYPISVHEAHDRNFGNAVLVRGEILDHRRVLVPHVSWTNGQRRGATVATVRVKGRTFVAVSAHTETAHSLRLDARLEQASRVASNVAYSWRPVVIGGDFNVALCGEPEKLEHRMSLYGFQRASRGVEDTAQVLLWRSALDHVFSRGLTVREAGSVETEASDHRPVWVTFEAEV